MTTIDEQLKTLVRETYAKVAEQGYEQNAASCCGSGVAGSTLDTALMADDYSQITGYVPEADLGLGCGLPTAFARIQPGDTVVDLGSGAGNDAFVARHETGPTGKVIGIDFTPAMIEKARRNAELRGFNNVEFRFGDIETMPLSDATANVVVSNCVLNLVPNKRKVFEEIYRVLKPGGHFSISDIVLVGELPTGIQTAAEMYAGCVSGAIQQADYLALIQQTGFEQITIQKAKAIVLPDDVLLQYLTPEALDAFREAGTGIVSLTVFAQKPDPSTPNAKESNKSEQVACCPPNTGCC
jgi:SAM-dependent methyltransferase